MSRVFWLDDRDHAEVKNQRREDTETHTGFQTSCGKNADPAAGCGAESQSEQDAAFGL
jgi:hypothetical protein